MPDTNLDLIRGRQVVLPLTNKSGAQRIEGEVVVADVTTDDSFDTTVAEGDDLVIGVVAETIENNAEGRVICTGYVATVEVDAATVRGDYLKTSTTAGEATPTATFDVGVFAIALSAVGGAGDVSAYLFGVDGSAGGGAHYVTDFIPWFYIDTGGGGSENQVNNFAVVLLGDGDRAHWNFHLPSDFYSLENAEIVILPDATETVQWDEATSYGAAGEGWGAPSESQNDVQQAVTINQIAELDVSGVLTGVAAGDYIGLGFTSNTDTLRIIGLKIRYLTT